MTQIFGSCNRYIQGYGELKNIKKHTEWMGKNFLIVASRNRLRDLKDLIVTAFGGAASLAFSEFGGECSREEIHKLENEARSCGAEVVVGIGGGKIADTVKVTAHTCNLKLVIVPTIAASDASTSAASLIYKNGVVEEVLNFAKSPELVLVDTEVLIKAPVRFFVAGMGDALSTYIGAKVCQDNYYNNHFSARGTHTALAIAKLSYDLLMRLGRQAKIAAEARAVSYAYNAIVEVNILMSGLGFENNGSASDHSFYFGTLGLPGREEYVFHGEGVAFSTCCQMIMQGAESGELDEVYRFCRDVGLPITFDDMRLCNLSPEEMDLMTKETLRQAFVHNHPFEVSYEKVCGAYETANAIGKLYKAGGSLV
jgi:glycerol dehydrogenase